MTTTEKAPSLHTSCRGSVEERMNISSTLGFLPRLGKAPEEAFLKKKCCLNLDLKAK
jgi:hypothetical protein